MRSPPQLIQLRLLTPATVVLLCVLPAPVPAVDYTWDAGVSQGDFNDPSSWVPGTGSPTTADTVTIDDAGTAVFIANEAVDSVTLSDSIGFRFQSNSGSRTLTVGSDIDFLDSAKLSLDGVRLDVGGQITGVTDSLVELIGQARITGGAIDGVSVADSSGVAQLDSVELRNLTVSRLQSFGSLLMQDTAIGPDVRLQGGSGGTYRFFGQTSLVGDSHLEIRSGATADLNGSLVGGGLGHEVSNSGELLISTLVELSFGDTPGVDPSLTIDNADGVLTIATLATLSATEGTLIIDGGLITGGGTLSARGDGLVLGDSTVLDGVDLVLEQNAPLTLGAGVTLQGASIELASQTDLLLEDVFVIDAASTITTDTRTRVLPGQSLVNHGLLAIHRGALAFTGDSSLTGTGQVRFSGNGALGIDGGGSLTIDAAQELVSDESSSSLIYGTGSGGTTLVNNGLIRYAEGAFGSVVQADDTTYSETAQDFTFINNNELRLDDDATLFFGSDFTPGLSLTLDNRAGVISLGSGSRLQIRQSSDIDNVLRGGEIVGTGDGSGEVHFESLSLRLTDTPTLTNATINAVSGEVTIDGDLVNNGLIRVQDALLRFEGDTTLSGDGVVLLDGTAGGPLLGLPGGNTVTVGPDQALSFRSGSLGSDNVLFGVGTGGTTIVNNGVTRVENDGAATVFQADEFSLGGHSVAATAQDFTLVNNGDLIIEDDATFAFQSDSTTGLSATIDNRAGVISLGSGARVLMQPTADVQNVIRGGQIVGTGDGSGGVFLGNGFGSLTLTDSPTLTDATIEAEPGGRLTIDGDLTNNGLVHVRGDLLRLHDGTTLSGDGVVRINALSSDPYVELVGGQTVTIGPDQTLSFRGGSLGQGGTIFAVGSGGTMIVNNGLFRVEDGGEATVFQANEPSLGPRSFDATAQDFTLVNNSELLLEEDATLGFQSGPVEGISTTLDNRTGLISLSPGSQLWISQSEQFTTTLRGGQIVGAGDGSGTLRVSNPTTPVVPSLVLADSPTLTNASIVVDFGAALTIEGTFNNNGMVRFVGGQLEASTGAWLGTGQVAFEEAQNGLASRIESLTEGAIRFGTGQQVRFTNGVTTLSGTTIAGSLTQGAGSLSIESGGTLRVESAPSVIDDLSLNVAGVLDARADLAASVPIPVAAGGELRIETGATVSAPGVVIDPGAVLTLDGGVLTTPSFVLNGSAVGTGTIATPNDPATPTQIGSVVNGTSLAAPIAFTGWIEGDGLLDNVLFEGTHSPGDGIAFVNAGSLAYGPSSDLRIEVRDQNVLSPGFDRLTASGSVTLGGDLDLQLVDYVADTLGLNDQLILLTSSGLSGQFANVAPGDRLLFDGGLASAQIDYGPTSPFNPNHVVFSEFVREPEKVFWVGGNSAWGSAVNWDILRVPNNQGPLMFHAIVNAGNIDVNVPVVLSRLTLNNLGSTVTLNQAMTAGDFHWTGGDLAGPNELTITGESTFDTGENVNTGSGLVNQGTVTWIDGDLTGTFNQQGFVNQGELLIELTEDHSFQYITNTVTGVIRHTGTARAWLGGNTGFENDGLVEITGGGTLRVGRDSNNGSDGDFVITDGVLESSVGFGADHKYNGSITGQEFRASAGNISINGTYDVETTVINSTTTFNTTTPAATDMLTLNSEGVAVETMLEVDQLEWNGGGFAAAGGQTVLTTSAIVDTPAAKTLTGRFTNQGEVSWRDGSFSQSASGLFRNEGTLLIELATEQSLYHVLNTTTGEIRHTTAAVAILGPTVGFENDGQVEITGGGTLRVGRDRNNGSDGDFVITDGVLESSVGFGADHKYNGSITGQEFRASAGNISINGTYDVETTTGMGGVVNFNTPSPAATDMLTLSSGEFIVETEFVFDQITWTGGGFGNSAGQPILIGQGVISGPAAKAVGTTLVNRGELTWNDGDVGTGSVTAARIRNEGVLTMDLIAPRSIVRLENPGSGQVFNLGANATISHLYNYGTLDVVASTVLLGGTLDNHSGTTLTGGEWIVRDGAAIDMGDRTITINNAGIRLFGAGSNFAAINPLDDNRGTFGIFEGRDFTTAGDLANSGSVIIGAGSTLTVSGVYTQTGAESSLQVDGEFISPGGPATFADGASLAGTGLVPGAVVIGLDGIVAPGSSPGTLNMDELAFSDGAIYEWEYDGVESDSIVASTALTFGQTATLRIVQLGGSPNPSDTFVLFDYPESLPDPTLPTWSIDGSAAPDWDVSSAVIYVDEIASRVLLTGIAPQFNPADFNEDGIVDAADYTVWRNNLHVHKVPFTSADGTGDGMVSITDYELWKQQFGAVGPSILLSPARSVPEPTAACLLLLCAAPLFRTSFVSRRTASSPQANMAP